MRMYSMSGQYIIIKGILHSRKKIYISDSFFLVYMPIKFENRAYTQQITLANVMEQINCCHHPSPGEPALF